MSALLALIAVVHASSLAEVHRRAGGIPCGQRPVWPEGRASEMNVTVGFRAVLDVKQGDSAALRIAASTLYRAFVNGKFIGHGPARGPHGHYRVDQWDLTGALASGANIVAIEVAGYNSNSYYLLDQPSFLQAEVTVGETLVAATGHPDKPFQAAILPERLQKVQRYSFQRPLLRSLSPHARLRCLAHRRRCRP